jgi:hypothetical protein
MAGDVNGDTYISAVDAGMIQKYFLTLCTGVSFDNKWEFWQVDRMISSQPQAEKIIKVTIPAGSAGVEQDFYGMLSGDFDRSNVPAASAPLSGYGAKLARAEEGSVTLQRGIELNVNAGELVELPLRATAPMQVGAISLIMDYPAGQMEVVDVYLRNDPALRAGYNFVNGMLVIGWNSVDPVSVAAGEALVTVKVKMTGEETGIPAYFSLPANPLNELANERMIAIDNATLVMDGIQMKGSVTGIDDNIRTSTLLMSCYPNPFADNATIRYTLPAHGRVSLDVTGIAGNRISILANQQQDEGEYTLDLDGAKLAPGVYHVVLRFTGQNGQPLVTTVRMIKK